MTNIRRKKLNEYIENYDNMFNTYKIRTICETEHIQSYYFYNGTGQFRRTESVLLIFHPEGITITGDLCPNGDGICSNRISSTFYKQNFTTDQLARKFNLKHDEFDQEIA